MRRLDVVIEGIESAASFVVSLLVICIIAATLAGIAPSDDGARQLTLFASLLAWSDALECRVALLRVERHLKDMRRSK